jgi:hypothetical protein
MNGKRVLIDFVTKDEAEILANWISEQLAGAGRRAGMIKDAELQANCREFLNLFRMAIAEGRTDDIEAANWTDVREMLKNLARARRAGLLPLGDRDICFFVEEAALRGAEARVRQRR